MEHEKFDRKHLVPIINSLHNVIRSMAIHVPVDDVQHALWLDLAEVLIADHGYERLELVRDLVRE